MKRLLSLFVLLAALPFLASAQNAVTVTGRPYNAGYTWPAMNSAGVSSTYIYTLDGNGAPDSFTIDEVTSGTAPSTCVYEVESSPDGVNWNSGSGSLSGSLSCTSVGVATTSFLSKPARYIRINVTTYSGGDGTTQLTFYYTRGK